MNRSLPGDWLLGGPAFLRKGVLSGCCMIILFHPAAAESPAPRIEGPPTLAFPSDHGAHPGYRTEWWYVTGIVADDAGARYGYQFTIFRQRLDLPPPRDGAAPSRLRAEAVMPAHLAVADLDRGRFIAAERLRRDDGVRAGARTGRLRSWVDDWEIEQREDGSLRLFAGDLVKGIGLQLELVPEREPVAHGDGGYSRKGDDPGNASAYVSLTRLRTTGTLRIVERDRAAGGKGPIAVSGTSWFDHEWGTSQLEPGLAGWDWFGLRLADGRDLMLYRLRRADGGASPWSAGTLVEPGGATVRLRAADFSLEPLESWRSPATGAEYPVRWRVAVPRAALALEVAAPLAACEVDARGSTGLVYWEGPVRVSGTVGGEGYGEFTGYHESVGGRF